MRQQTGVIDQETQARRMVIEAEAMAQKRALEGYTYKDERGFDVAERVASNEAVGQMTNMGVGLGMMAGVGGTVGSMVGGMMQNTMGSVLSGAKQEPRQPASNTAACAGYGNSLPPNAKFCLECGRQVLADNEIICPSCGVKTPKGKFCLECGAAMAGKCPECGTEIPPGGKFCLECGHKLQ